MNTPVNMRFGGEIKDRIAIIGNGCHHCLAVADIALHKRMPRLVHAGKVLEIAGVSKRVEIYYPHVIRLAEHQSDECRSDKSRATCYENRSHKKLRPGTHVSGRRVSESCLITRSCVSC